MILIKNIYINIFIIIIISIIFYIIIIYPEYYNKKKHNKLINSLVINDIILINGIIGKIFKINNKKYITILINKKIKIIIYKKYINKKIKNEKLINNIKF